MKNIILSIFLIGTLLSSCNDNGKKVEVKDAQEVVKSEATTSFETINPQSRVHWRATHLGGLQPRFGVISLKSSELHVSDNKLRNASIVIDMNSLTVENFDDEESKNKLKGHLQSPDFFKVEAYPTSKFELTGIKGTEGDYNSLVTGNLTIMDATKSISFSANISITENEIIIKSEDFAVDRTDWGLTYNTEGTKDVPTDYLIANDIGFTIDIVTTK